MTVSLLPPDINDLVTSAVRLFWHSRRKGTGAQGGNRSKVLAGKNMDGFLHVVQAIIEHCGLPATSVFTQGRGNLTLPGYYRPTKMWDALVVFQGRLLAAFEFKSQVGSFGNNSNNRTEEALGSATDFQMAAEQSLYAPSNYLWDSDEEAKMWADTDPRPPFVGYLMLLQDCEDSTTPTKSSSAHFKLSSDFESASYADRYRILCEKMMRQKLYNAASLVLSKEDDLKDINWRSLSEATDVMHLFAAFAGHIAAARPYLMQ